MIAMGHRTPDNDRWETEDCVKDIQTAKNILQTSAKRKVKANDILLMRGEIR